MTVPEILRELEPYTGRFPLEAMRAAVEQREALTPELLKVLETAAADPVEFAKRKDYMLLVFGIYLLAQFRERRAYAPLVRMFRAPDETPFDLVGDTVTDALHQILGSVYDGDPAPLQGLVEDENVNDYVRSSALDAFIVLARSGQMTREEVVAYYQSLFRGRLRRKHSHAWDGLVTSTADLPAPELLADVRWAYAEGLVDPGFASLKGIERDLLDPKPKPGGNFDIITDAIKELRSWAAFAPETPVPRRPPPPPPAPMRASSSPSSNEPPPSSEPAVYMPPKHVRWSGVGRNDPCPCGSGKKYKKCCGGG